MVKLEVKLTEEEFATLEECLAYCIGKRKQYGLTTKIHRKVLNKIEKEYLNSIGNGRDSK